MSDNTRYKRGWISTEGHPYFGKWVIQARFGCHAGYDSVREPWGLLSRDGAMIVFAGEEVARKEIDRLMMSKSNFKQCEYL